MNEIDTYNKKYFAEDLSNYKINKKIIDSFVKLYPINKIKKLSLKDYLISKKGYGNDRSFCNRIRYDFENIASFGNVRFDIFGVYINGGTDITLSPTFKKMYGNDYKIAFQYIKELIYKLLLEVGNDNYLYVSKCKLNSAFKFRLIMIYYPEKILPVIASETLNAYCDCLGVKYNKKEDMIFRNLNLKNIMENIPEMTEWTNYNLMCFADRMWRKKRVINIYKYQDVALKKISTEIDNEIKKTGLVGEEKKALIKIRINQSFFRDKLVKKYGKCCLCNIKNKNLLLASHIKPWSSSNPYEKTDINNGLILCPGHDKLFDKGYITFDNYGKIIISSDLSQIDMKDLNINNKMRIPISEKNIKYLDYHRKYIYRDKKGNQVC